MKRHLLLLIGALSIGAINLSDAQAQPVAPVAIITTRPQDRDGRPVDPQYTIAVNPNGTLGQVLAGSSGTQVNVTPVGDLQVQMMPTTIFNDPFDGGAVDTTNNWTTQLGTGGTVTQATGSLSITALTSASAYAAIFSKPTFSAPVSATQTGVFQIQLESPIKANVKRFWGFGSVPGTPTVAVPITDGAGFELTEAGVFRAVIYNNGVVINSQNLATPSANAVVYSVTYSNGIYFFYSSDSPAFTPVATLFGQPAVQNIPFTALAVNAATPPSAGQSMTVTFAAVGDYAKNTNQLSDGVYAFRKATVKAPNTASTTADLPLVVTLAPIGSLPPAGTGTTNLGKAEDNVAASADTGVFQLGVRRDTLTSSASATGDYAETVVDTFGSQQIRSYEKMAKTYSASANITLAASATDIAILPGNATNTVYVTKVIISGIQTTSGLADVQLIKRSTANSGGTSSSITVVPNDSTDAAGVSVPLAYTANPTPGTSVGAVRRTYIPFNAAASISEPPSAVFEFGDKGRPIILRGVAQGLAVNLNGATFAGGVVNVSYEYFEQ